MATMDRLQSNKRKRDPSLAAKGGRSEKPYPKKQQKRLDEPPKPQKSSKPHLPSAVDRKKEPQTQRERRLLAKEMVEARKKKRKPNYNLEKELASLWEKMRHYNIGKEERSKLVSEALLKMSGKFLEIASFTFLHVFFKHASNTVHKQKGILVFEALRPDFLNLSRKKYAVHIVKKVLDNATKKQLEGFISSLHGHVASLLRHTVGSAVVEHAFHLANGSQRQSFSGNVFY